MISYIGNVASGQEDLGNGLPEMGEQAVPETHQATLANGRKCLRCGVLVALSRRPS